MIQLEHKKSPFHNTALRMHAGSKMNIPEKKEKYMIPVFLFSYCQLAKEVAT